MDLTNFTKKKETSKIVEEIILDNEDIKIVKKGDDINYTLKNKKALEKYQDYLFMGATKKKILNSEKEANDFFRESINRGCEGLMVKALDAKYTPGLRSGNMAKLKENNEPIDCVILGAEWGTGKRAGFFSSFYIGVLDNQNHDEEQSFLTIGKVASGILEIGETGHSLKNLTRLLKPLKISEENGITKFSPEIILEVEYQEIQPSTTYDSGYALRFPRILRLREDKTLDEINTITDMDNFS